MSRWSDETWHEGRAVAYVSFLSALVHHGVLVEGVAAVQVASLDRGGETEVGGTPVSYHLLPRDLWFGHEAGTFEGRRVPVATPEKALLDWCWLAEERGLDPRLDEMEWSVLDLDVLDGLSASTGVDYRRALPRAGASKHDQDRLRGEGLAALRISSRT